MTLRDGKIVYELNGLSRPDWTTLPKGYRSTGDPRWDGDPQLQRRPERGRYRWLDVAEGRRDRRIAGYDGRVAGQVRHSDISLASHRRMRSEIERSSPRKTRTTQRFLWRCDGRLQPSLRVPAARRVPASLLADGRPSLRSTRLAT